MSAVQVAARKSGEDFLLKAKEKAGSFSWFNAQGKWEAVAELYEKAGAQFKIAQAWDQAGDAYAQAASIHFDKLSSRSDGISALTNAGQAFKHAAPTRAVASLSKAAVLLMGDNRFAPAAKLWAEVGDIEADANLDRPAAITAYCAAADAYKACGSAVTAQTFTLKAADLRALSGQHAAAIKAYEAVAESQADNGGVAASCVGHYFKALLTRMAMEAGQGADTLAGTEEAVDNYVDILPRLRDAKEATLVRDLCKAYASGDADTFVGVLHRYDSVYRLDTFAQTLLYAVKKAMKTETHIPEGTTASEAAANMLN